MVVFLGSCSISILVWMQGMGVCSSVPLIFTLAEWIVIPRHPVTPPLLCCSQSGVLMICPRGDTIQVMTFGHHESIYLDRSGHSCILECHGLTLMLHLCRKLHVSHGIYGCLSGSKRTGGFVWEAEFWACFSHTLLGLLSCVDAN